MDGETKYSLDPNAAVKVEQAVEVAGGIATLLVPFLPWLAPIITAGGGAYATYKTQKPKLVKAQTESEAWHNAASTMVLTFEKFKKTNPAEAEKLSAKFADTMGIDVENVIRALRGLPPKA